MFTCLKLGHSGVMVYGVFMGVFIVYLSIYNFRTTYEVSLRFFFIRYTTTC